MQLNLKRVFIQVMDEIQYSGEAQDVNTSTYLSLLSLLEQTIVLRY